MSVVFSVYTTLKVIGTNCIVSCKSIYHTIRTTTALFCVIHNLSIPDLILKLFWQIFHMSYFPFGEQNGRTTERTKNLRICFKNLYSYFNLVKEVNFRGNFNKITSCYNIKLYTKYRPATSHWQTLSHNVISSRYLREQDSNSQLKWWNALDCIALQWYATG
jgi:hypothetical protein